MSKREESETIASKEDLQPLKPGSAGWGLRQVRAGIVSWIGTVEKPLVYGSKRAAKIAARILDARMNTPAGRTRVAWYEPEKMHRVQDFQPVYSAEEALRRLEEGLIL